MNGKSLLLTLSVGLTTFLLVGGAVTAIFEQWVEFSVFIGISVGLLAAAVAGGGVAVGLSEEASNKKWIARIVAGFSLGFLLSLAVLLLLWNSGITVSLGISIAVGLVAAVLVDWVQPSSPAGNKLSPTG
ncbi:hypothetical protein [Halodesulfurarchaeum sp.]|uniref:hypothetical protein n=1 Tax=Halodesulfurarchaeum sp. TaxID=1980530 RepID=UPI001BBFACA0|nr:hypothetical protein [Halodesulfurarchaeum sp.]